MAEYIVKYRLVVKKQEKESGFYLYRRLKFYTKEFLKIFNIVIIALDFIITIVLIKYKPMYKVNIAGKEIGYVENTQELEEKVK